MIIYEREPTAISAQFQVLCKVSTMHHTIMGISSFIDNVKLFFPNRWIPRHLLA